MPDFFSYFTPKKLASLGSVEYSARENVVENTGITRPDLIIDEGDVDGILNDNFNDCCDLGHAIDLSSVESLSTALLKLESEKECLENEIMQQYHRINMTELSDIVTRVISVTQIETDFEDKESQEEVEEMLGLLKSTASFVERRLRKIRMKMSSLQSEKLQDTLPLSSSEEHNICVAGSQDDEAELEVEGENDEDFISNSNEGNQLEIAETEVDQEHDDDNTETDKQPNEIIDDDEGSEAGNDCDRNLDVESIPNDDDNLQDLKSKFGSKRTRWSIRKVFKKNF